jgi:hypothetical protein
MRLLQSVILFTALASTAFARCYPASEKKEAWKDKNDAKNAVKDACREFQGNYRMNQQKNKCINGRGGQRYEFYSLMDQNPENKGVYHLEEWQCNDRYLANVDCERGGQTTNKFMTFTSVLLPQLFKLDIMRLTASYCRLIPNKGKC